MTVACALKERTGFGRLNDRFTPGVSREAQSERESWVAAAMKRPVAPAEQSTEEQLSEALSSALEAVQQNSQYVSASDREAIGRQLNLLLSRDYWDDDDEILKVASVRTMLRVISALARGAGELTASRGGNLVSTWSLDDHVLRVEALPTGKVAWTALHPRGSAPRHEHNAGDTVENLKGLLEHLLRQPGGSSERG